MYQIKERNIIGQLVKDDQIELLTRQSDLKELITQDDEIIKKNDANQQQSGQSIQDKQQNEWSQSTSIQQSRETTISKSGEQSKEKSQQSWQQSQSLSIYASSGEQSQQSLQQKQSRSQDKVRKSNGQILFFYKSKDLEDDLYCQGGQQNNYNGLQKLFQLIINGRPINALEQLQKSNQTDLAQYQIKALIYLRIGQFDEALKTLSYEIQKIDENMFYEFLRFYNQGIIIHPQVGVIYLYKSDFKNAKDSFLKAQLIDSSDYYVNYNIAYCYIKLKLEQEARKLLVFQSAVNKHKDLSFKLLGLMHINNENFHTKNKYSEAIKQFDEAIYQNPKNYKLYFIKATTILIWNISVKKSNKENTQQYIPDLEESVRLFEQFKLHEMTSEEKSKAQNNLLVCLIFQGIEKNRKYIEEIIKDQQFCKDQQINNNIGNYYSLICRDKFAREKYEICTKLNDYKLAMLNLGMLELRSQKSGAALRYFNESILNYDATQQVDSGNVIYRVEGILNQCKLKQLLFFKNKVQELNDIKPSLILTYRYWLSQTNIVAIQQNDYQKQIFLFDLKLDQPSAFEGFRFEQFCKIRDVNYQDVKVFEYEFNDIQNSKIKDGKNLDLNLEIKAIFVKSDKIFQNSLIYKEKNYVLIDKYRDGDLIKFIYQEENNIIKQLLNRSLVELEEILNDLQQQLSLRKPEYKIILEGCEIQIEPSNYNQILGLKTRYLRFKEKFNPINALNQIKDQAIKSKELFADFFQSLNFDQIIFICYQIAIKIKSGTLNQDELIYLNEYQQIVREVCKDQLRLSQQQFNLMIHWLFKRQPQIKRDFDALKSLALALKKNFNPIYILQKLVGGQIDVVIDKILYKLMNQDGGLIFCCLNEIILEYNENENKTLITQDQLKQKIQLSAPLKIFKIKCGRILDIDTLKYSLRAQDQIIKQYLDKITELKQMSRTFTQQDVTNFIIVQDEKNNAIFKLIFLEHQIETLGGKEHIYKLIKDLEEFFEKLFQVRDIRQIRKNIFDCLELTWTSSQGEGLLIQERTYVSQGKDLSSTSF